MILLRTNLAFVLAIAYLSSFEAVHVWADDGASRFALSDSRADYVHWIELYDADSTLIDPTAENPRPYSTEMTCGRCHDYDSISHGWHFNAAEPGATIGRPGQPWIWNDPRTGTSLPLSYRRWEGTYDPDSLGLTRWSVAAKFGGYLPGGGVGSEASLKKTQTSEEDSDSVKPDEPAADASDDSAPQTDEASQEDSEEYKSEDRSAITGPMPVDCMLCHRGTASAYSPVEWSEQIESQNFAYAPTVAAALATIEGSMKSIKEPIDPNNAERQAELPKLKYDATRFRSDGKVFFDVVRKPRNESCYHCHTNVPTEQIGLSRWEHDTDFHVQAGMACADCHRNGIDHHIVRGYEGEQLPTGKSLPSLSCQGCHIGSNESTNAADDALVGRLGAPKPEHRGLPPLHFEKLSCTACHSGPQLSETPARWMNSITHQLGHKEHRVGDELPGIIGPVMLPIDQEFKVNASTGKYTPHKLTWPSFWGVIEDGKLRPLNPDQAFELTRKATKVRKDFREELATVKLSLKDREAILGEDRAKAKPEELTAEETAKLDAEIAKRAEIQAKQAVYAALDDIEKAIPNSRAVHVSGGVIRAKWNTINKFQIMDDASYANFMKPYAWAIGHDVRPARQSLGAKGCVECHSNNAPFFAAAVTPVATMDRIESESKSALELQGADFIRLSLWNQMFGGRTWFKYAAFVSIGLALFFVLGSAIGNFNSWLTMLRTRA